MQVVATDRGKSLAESTIAWWRDAGVEYLCGEEPVNWLTAPAVAAPKPVSKAATATSIPSLATRPAIDPVWPGDLAALVQAIATDPSMPGNGYGRRIAAPVPAANAQLMVFCDFPEEAELAAASLGNGPTGQLLRAMVRACGYESSSVHITALAHSRPASGALPTEDGAVLADFARHQIATVKPARLLLLGSAVSEILTGKDLMTARADLQNFNHDGRIMASVATFHPRTLLARPVLKAQAWQDLQAILKKDPV